jgi:pilus assembly protein Flp/PilA
MRADLKKFWRNEDGATAIEYGLIVAVLSLAVVMGIGLAADAIAFLFGDTGSHLVQAFSR